MKKIFKTAEQEKNFIGVVHALTGQEISSQDIRKMDSEKILGILEQAFSGPGIQRILTFSLTPLNDLYRAIKGCDNELFKALVGFHG